jgi:hypothetical protein
MTFPNTHLFKGELPKVIAYLPMAKKPKVGDGYRPDAEARATSVLVKSFDFITPSGTSDCQPVPTDFSSGAGRIG